MAATRSECLICERCWHPIAPEERYWSVAHIESADTAGRIRWRHAHVHFPAENGACRTAR